MAISSMRYCLIAQDNSKSLQVVNLTLSDYPMNGYKLEEIDLYTTQFSCEKELLEDLYRNKLISHLDVNLFIAFESPITGKVEKYNVLYNHSRKALVQNIRQVAWQSLSGFLGDGSDLDNIMTAFSMRVVVDGNYYKMIDFGLSQVDSELLQLVESQAYFVSFSDVENFAAERSQTPYEVFRNIVESFVNYKYYLFEILGNGLTTAELLDYDQFRWLSRFEDIDVAVLSDLLTLVYDGKQLSGQLILDGWCLPVNANAFLPLSLDPVKSSSSRGSSRRFLVRDIPFDQNVNIPDKRLYVMDTLDLLPPNCLKKTGEDSAKFVSDKFQLSDDQKFKLENYLDSECRKLFHLYIENKYGKQNTQQSENVASEVNELRRVTGSYKGRINRYLFHHDEALNRAYEWCKVFNEAMGNNIPLPKGKKSRRSGAYVKRYPNKNGS